MPQLPNASNIGTTQCGLDLLQAGKAPEIQRLLAGRKVGLLTNHTGYSKDNRTTCQVLQDLDIKVVALFSPEHGATGTREGKIESSETKEGLPIHSLYGESRRPACNVLADISAFVCDIQDVGARFYTYATTLAYCMEACAGLGIPVVVLDRPNPLDGITIEGPTVEDAERSFVGYLRVPIRHGLTMGELAEWHRRDAGLNLDLHLAPVEGWRREDTWPQTGLRWPVPSPNLPDYQSAAWYPGPCLLEFSGVSVGRGTPAPFQIIGAPWLDPDRLIQQIKAWPIDLRRELAVEKIDFTPTRATYEGVLCRGIRLSVATDEVAVPRHPVGLGLALLATLYRIHPEEFSEAALEASVPLLGSRAVLELIREGNIEGACEVAESDAASFRQQRQEILIY